MPKRQGFKKSAECRHFGETLLIVRHFLHDLKRTRMLHTIACVVRILCLMASMTVIIYIIVHAQHTFHTHLTFMMMMRYIWNYKEQHNCC